MKTYTLLFCLLLWHTIGNAQPTATDTCKNQFPQCFIGHWKGQLQWMMPRRNPQLFTMQLIIQPTANAGEYTWQIIYGDSATTDNRPYLLKPIDSAAGHWVVDEQNGIVLDSYVFGQTMLGAFTVQANTITDKYRVQGDSMLVEFTSIRLQQKNSTGKGTDASPTVDSYRIASFQSGVLQKLK
jgi:hypothetical protein